MLPANCPTNSYPVLKTLLAIILLIREEGANPRTSPTKDRDNEGNLDFVARMDEMIVVDGPECVSEPNQLLFTEQVLRLLFAQLGKYSFLNGTIPLL